MKKACTIIIPTWNRFSVLVKTLEKLKGFRDPHLQVIVYDDCSERDFTADLISQFSETGFIFKRSDRHVGPCELRNRMIREASSEFIIGLDDDSCFVSKQDCERAIDVIQTVPQAAIVGFKVLVKNGIQFPKFRNDDLCLVGTFLAGAFIARKNFLLKVGGFDPSFIRGGGERDLAIRLLDAGWDIYVCSNVEVFHERSSVARDRQANHGYAFRNGLLFYLKYFSGVRCPLYILRHFLLHTAFCLVKGWFGAYWFGVRGFVCEFSRTLRTRKIVKRETMIKYLTLRRQT